METVKKIKAKALLDEMADRYEKEGVLKLHASDYVNHHFQRFIKTLHLIPKKSPKLKVLDIGIHGGWMAILVKEIFGYQVFGIDIERKETEVWRRFFKSEGIVFKTCDLTKQSIPFEDDTFDFVLFCEVLEHVPAFPLRIFQEINRVLKRGGNSNFHNIQPQIIR